MILYNLEIFDINDNSLISEGWSRYLNVYHHQITTFNYSYDYFKKEANTIEVPSSDAVTMRQVVRITNAININEEYIGIVTGIERRSDGMMKITYSDFINIFMDLKNVFDTKIQRTAGMISLESYLADRISIYASEQGWASIDWSPQIEIVQTTDEVKNWGFNLKADIENTNYSTQNFKTTFIDRGAKEFDVWVREKFSSRYMIEVLKPDNSIKFIETNAPYVIKSEIVFESNKESANRLNVYNAENGVPVKYYLHPDGAVDQNPRGATVPPVYSETLTNSTESRTFEQRAEEEAKQILALATGNNYIEIEVLRSALDFITWQVGQKVRIFTEDRSIDTILTGKKIGDTMTLIFGTVRMDLTKKINRR